MMIVALWCQGDADRVCAAISGPIARGVMTIPRARFTAALATIEPRQANLLLDRYGLRAAPFEGLPVRRLAEQHGLSTARIYQLLARAREALTRALHNPTL